MKIYTDRGNFVVIDGKWIPKDLQNGEYLIFLEEEKNKEAQLVTYSPPVNWEIIRQNRDQLLKESDWTLLNDATPKPNKEAWLDYRQTLRDITSIFSTPESVIWPTRPDLIK